MCGEMDSFFFYISEHDPSLVFAHYARGRLQNSRYFCARSGPRLKTESQTGQRP